jgi:hypothetical protein
VSNFNSIRNLNSPLLNKEMYIHRFQDLGPRHLCRAVVLPPTDLGVCE